MDKIKVGIIGTGFIGAVHVDALRRVGGVRIVALAEATQELAERKAAEYGIAKAYGRYEGWLDGIKNSVQAFYDFIRQGKDPACDGADFATFHDGHDVMLILDAIAESSRTGAWVAVRRD